jgi:hypothetical protein
MITVRKLAAVRTQLETAISLYFGGGDPVSIHTLTAAAYMASMLARNAATGSRHFLAH